MLNIRPKFTRKRVTQEMISKIQKAINRHSGKIAVVDQPVLPLMHSTTCENTENILENNLLSVTPCDVFGTKLLYFFYGKPAYRVSAKISDSSTSYTLAPCCFIVKPDKIKPEHIYPFDTGAFAADRYDEITKMRTEMCEYELSARIDDIPQFVCMFYENNQKYLEGRVSVAHGVETTIAVRALTDLLGSSGFLKYDDRARTIEISTTENLALSDVIEAIVVPIPFTRNEVFNEFIKMHSSIKVLTYMPHYPNPVSSYNEAIFQIVFSYLASRGLCDG